MLVTNRIILICKLRIINFFCDKKRYWNDDNHTNSKDIIWRNFAIRSYSLYDIMGYVKKHIAGPMHCTCKP